MQIPRLIYNDHTRAWLCGYPTKGLPYNIINFIGLWPHNFHKIIAILRGCFDAARRTIVFRLDQRDIAAVDDEDRAHCIVGQIVGALKEGNRESSMTFAVAQSRLRSNGSSALHRP